MALHSISSVDIKISSVLFIFAVLKSHNDGCKVFGLFIHLMQGSYHAPSPHLFTWTCPTFHWMGNDVLGSMENLQKVFRTRHLQYVAVQIEYPKMDTCFELQHLLPFQNQQVLGTQHNYVYFSCRPEIDLL